MGTTNNHEDAILREKYLAQMEQERERLREEERRAPHDHALLAAWQLADMLSGEAHMRAASLQILDRDIVLLRCGYRRPVSSPYNLVRGLQYIVTFDGERTIGTISQHFMDNVPMGVRDWLHLLDHHEGQHHMACKRCSEPVLRRVDREKAIELMHNSSNPSVPYHGSFEAFEERLNNAIQVEYRTISGGPESTPITSCQRCGTPLNAESVCEVKL